MSRVMESMHMDALGKRLQEQGNGEWSLLTTVNMKWLKKRVIQNTKI
jgi:hypothetical protein